MVGGGHVLGIDPGSRFMGYGVVSAGGEYVASGRLVVSPRLSLPERLRDLHAGLREVIGEFGPAVAVVEKVFFAKSVRSALTLGEARGMAILAAAQEGLEIHEYAASEVKLAVTGYGRAEKGQVAAMVREMLHLRGELSPDGADALALALCYLNRRRFDALAGRT